ncbi:hypothetical protein DFH28DRAFT_929139 [Melampsora americana]|nr:hypothetical protein DFH28DRAFT_929139 [Melampsora americana]
MTMGPGHQDFPAQLILQTSGDHKLEIALNSIREARIQSQVSTNGHRNFKKFSKPKPDPHLHTLNRYQTFYSNHWQPIHYIDLKLLLIYLKVLILIIEIKSSPLPDSQWVDKSNSNRPSTHSSSSETNSLQTDQQEVSTEMEKIGSKRRWTTLDLKERSDKASKKDVTIHKGHISYILCDED